MKPLLFWMSILIATATHGDLAVAQDRQSVNADAQRYGSRKRGGVLRNTRLPDLDAHLADGKAIKLRALCDGKYTVLVAGCLTCPQFHRGYPEVEAASKDFSPKKNVQFFYFYKCGGN